MAPHTTIIHLPNGQTLTVSHIFGGLRFISNDLIHSHDHCPFPPGWTVVINSVDGLDGSEEDAASQHAESTALSSKIMIHPFHSPTLNHDHLFISSTSQPASSDFTPVGSPTRQIAMMLWATLYWYFQQPGPDAAKKVKGDWRIMINREGIFKGRTILPKLERMGLIACENSAIGTDVDEKTLESKRQMFVSRKSFWQLDPRTFLFTLALAHDSPGGTPQTSRPTSPSRLGPERSESEAYPGRHSPGPFTSASHLPTYYPPPPPQYTFTDGIRHPIRPKPGKQCEILYIRFIPSVGQYLSFRIASDSPSASRYRGPTSASATAHATLGRLSLSDSVLPTVGGLHADDCDIGLLHKWMNEARVSLDWVVQGPKSEQDKFLQASLRKKHSVPLIGCFDGKPFGYFELYWVKEDSLGKVLGKADDYDRGIRCLAGEQEFQDSHRVKIWLSGLVHYCWLADNRTNAVMLEPSVDNERYMSRLAVSSLTNPRLLKYCLEEGFKKEKDLSFPHKQANLLKVTRSSWEAPEV
jgi:hypothetical protein